MVFNAKPLQDAAALMDRGDHARASEKLWDAVTLAVKASTGEWNAEGPREMRRLVDRLFRATEDRELLRLYGVAESLRANAAEDFMSGEAVRAYAEDVRVLIEKLNAMDPGSHVAPALGGPPPAVSRQADFETSLQGLSRREARKEVLAELARIDGQLESLKPAQAVVGIPGSPEARIANALQQIDRREDPAGHALGLYRQWLLGVLTRAGS